MSTAEHANVIPATAIIPVINIVTPFCFLHYGALVCSRYGRRLPSRRIRITYTPMSTAEHANVIPATAIIPVTNIVTPFCFLHYGALVCIPFRLGYPLPLPILEHIEADIAAMRKPTN
jgi:hypothetical protein